jgi:hypothetical protein
MIILGRIEVLRWRIGCAAIACIQRCALTSVCLQNGTTWPRMEPNQREPPEPL